MMFAAHEGKHSLQVRHVFSMSSMISCNFMVYPPCRMFFAECPVRNCSATYVPERSTSYWAVFQVNYSGDELNAVRRKELITPPEGKRFPFEEGQLFMPGKIKNMVVFRCLIVPSSGIGVTLSMVYKISSFMTKVDPVEALRTSKCYL